MTAPLVSALVSAKKLEVPSAPCHIEANRTGFGQLDTIDDNAALSVLRRTVLRFRHCVKPVAVVKELGLQLTATVRSSTLRAVHQAWCPTNRWDIVEDIKSIGHAGGIADAVTTDAVR